MELQLIDGNDIELGGDCDFEMPAYMTRLSPDEVCKTSDPNVTIIAAGADPNDGKITLVTMAGKVLVFDARSFYIPDGPVIPASGGVELHLMNLDGRWPGDSEGFYVDSSWVIEKSVSALTGAVVKISYPNEDDPR